MPPKLLDETAISFVQQNPKRAGSQAYTRYELYKLATTVGEALKKGAVRGDVQSDIKQGHCKLLGDAGAEANKALQPKAGGAPKRPAGAAAVAEGASSEKKRRVEAAAPTTPQALFLAPVRDAPGVAVSALGRATEAATQAVSSVPSSAPRRIEKADLDTVDLSFAKLDGKNVKYIKRTMGEARRLLCQKGLEEAREGGYEFLLLDRENLSRWAVRLRDLNPDGQLSKDLKARGLDQSIDLELSLPDTFPIEPPFVRLVWPELTGGFVFSHGGICFEPLTPKGWLPSMTLPALAIAIKGIMDFGGVRLAGVGDKAARTVKHYTMEGARKDHKHISAAHRDGDAKTYTSVSHLKS